MTQYHFGSGTVIGKRTDVANTQPALLGVLQDITVDFDRTLKELIGQYQMPVAIAASALKITGKAKFGRFQATQFNNLFFGATQATGMTELALAEAATIPGSPFQVTVSNGATFVEDFGVFDATTGVQYTPVPSGPTTGQYIAGAVGVGQYTFAAADTTKAVVIYYSYTVSTAGTSKITLANQLMGQQPVFKVALKNKWTDPSGTVKDLVLVLNSCVSSKITMPFSNQDWSIPELDFSAFADASNNLGTLSLTE